MKLRIRTPSRTVEDGHYRGNELKPKLNPKRLVIFIIAVVPAIILIPAMIASGSSSPGRSQRHAAGQVITRHCGNAGSGCDIAMEPRLHAPPLIHHLLTSAISIADRL